MHSHRFKLAALAAIALAQATPGQAENRTAQSSFSESGEGEDYAVRIVNSTFATDLLFAPDFADSINVIYEQRITSEEAAGMEGVRSELEVTARSGGKKLWSIRDNANEGEALGEYYRTTVWGCCGSENTHRHYSAWTGKLAFTATADPLFAAIPNTPTRRAFSYLSAYAAEGFDPEVWPRGAALLAIVDGDRAVDRVLLELGEGAEDFVWTPEITLADPTGQRELNGDTFDLWAADGDPDPQGITGFELVLTWNPELDHIGRLPVVAGRFDLANAVLPAGLTARRLKAD